VEILRELRLGNFDVLIGINLLREGLDLPEVSLVAILDADKEGYLRSETSLTQTAGRAARNVDGKVIMYGDKITDSMQRTIDETYRRRAKQIEFNEQYNITPETIKRSRDQILRQTSVADNRKEADPYLSEEQQEQAQQAAADPVTEYMSKEDLEQMIRDTHSKMMKAAQETQFMEAARLRDEMYQLKEQYKEKFGQEFEVEKTS
jgi:excinuclease ABC subunit B